MADISMPSTKQILMLSALSVLLLVKFALQPYYQQRAEQLDALALLNQQVERTTLLLSDNSLPQDLQATIQVTRQLETQFLPFNSNAEFRLQVQQMAERLLAHRGARLEVFDWVAASEATSDYLQVQRASIAFSGTTEQVIQLQFDLLQGIPGLTVIEYSLTPQRTRFRSSAARQRVSLVVEVSGVKA